MAAIWIILFHSPIVFEWAFIEHMHIQKKFLKYYHNRHFSPYAKQLTVFLKDKNLP